MSAVNHASMFAAMQHAAYPAHCARNRELLERPEPPLPAKEFSICYPSALAVRTMDLRAFNARLADAPAVAPTASIGLVAETDLDRLYAALLDRICGPELMAASRWIDEACSSTSLIESGTLRRVFASAVLQEVGRFLGEPLLFELNLALKESLIEGSDLASVMASACHLLAEPDYREYLGVKYPLIAQRAARRISLVSESLQRLLQRLQRDLPDVCRVLDLSPSDARLTDIQRGAGDSHHGADGVTVLTFGDACRVVYKPRSMDCEVAYNQFIAWFNERQPDRDLHLMAVRCLARDGYGWMRYVEHASAPDAAAVERYFRRYGALAAVLDLLNATDIHYENLIACGEHPVAIDLETIFQPTRVTSASEDSPPIGIMDLDFFTGGVYFTGMFDPIFLRGSLNGSPLAGPRTWLRNSGNLVYDAVGGQLSRGESVRELAKAHCIFEGGRLRSGYDHADAIRSGFRQAYQLLLRHKFELLGGVLDEFFGQVQVRVIFRETARYGELLRARDSAYCLESVSQSDEFLFKLLRQQEGKGVLRHLFPAEYEACLDGDVPYFFAYCRSREVMGGAGLVQELRLAMSGMAETRQRLLRANGAYVDRAEGCIAYSLAMKRAEREGQATVPSADEDRGIPADPAAIIDIVRQRVVIREGGLQAVDLVLGNDLATKHRVLGDDLYLGLPGVVLASAQHDRLTRGALSAETVGLAERLFDRLHAHESARLGACVGLGGYVYLAARLAALGHDAVMHELAEDLLAQANELAYMDRHFDVFSGLAGTVLSAAAVVKQGGSEPSRQYLRQLAATLMSHGEWSGQAITWKSSIPSQGAISGFGHGASGIGCALVRAFHHTGERQFLDGAIGVHHFLQLCRSDAHGWRDAVRSQDKSLHAWCHGAPGIGLFYRELHAVLPKDEYLACLDLAVTHTLSALDYENDSLCHGSLGNADLLLDLPATLGRADEVAQALDALQERLSSRPLRCGNVLKHQSLALFTGVTGMAYQLMRLRAPWSVPSVLTFDVELRLDD